MARNARTTNVRLPIIPKSCPFTIEEFNIDGKGPSEFRNTTFLIREHDQYGEFPHIYAKICQNRTESHNHRRQLSSADTVIVLSDTGCGTEVPAANPCATCTDTTSGPREPDVWNIATFLEYTLNPGGRIPYLIMTTHCHYDHIMGIGKLSPTSKTQTDVGGRPASTVLTSSRGKSFVTPYLNLQKHSLAGTLGLRAPVYDVGIWADDFSQVVYPIAKQAAAASTAVPASAPITTPYTILQTPGHTPDSLSWYDAEHRVLCVGDSFYLKESPRGAPWGLEPDMPTMFDLESDLADWWQSLHKVLEFAVRKNRELAGEVTRSDECCEILQHCPAQVSHPVRESLEMSHQGGGPRQGGYLKFSNLFHRGLHNGRQSGYDQPPLDQDGSPPEVAFQEVRDACLSDESWLSVHLQPSALPNSQRSPTQHHPELGHRRPRVHLAAAHTTSKADALPAIVEVKAFMRRILRDEVPKARFEAGPRGEERWLWDDALGGADSDVAADRAGHRGWFSVLAPLVVVEEGRSRIPRQEWT